YIAHLHLVGRNVDRFAIYQDCLVRHELTRLCTRGTEAHAVGNVVQAAFEQLQQVFAGRALATGSFLVVAAELLLEDAVKATYFLLLAQLHAVVRQAATTLAVLAGRGFNLALGVDGTHTAGQEQVGSFAAGKLTSRSSVSCHYSISS